MNVVLLLLFLADGIVVAIKLVEENSKDSQLPKKAQNLRSQLISMKVTVILIVIVMVGVVNGEENHGPQNLLCNAIQVLMATKELNFSKLMETTLFGVLLNPSVQQMLLN